METLEDIERKVRNWPLPTWYKLSGTSRTTSLQFLHGTYMNVHKQMLIFSMEMAPGT